MFKRVEDNIFLNSFSTWKVSSIYTNTFTEVTTTTMFKLHLKMIHIFITRYYVSFMNALCGSTEAAYIINTYSTHIQSHAVILLPVHFAQHSISLFHKWQCSWNTAKSRMKNTGLMNWFKRNKNLNTTSPCTSDIT